MELLQLLQLNFKTIMTLVKLYLTAILTVKWSGIEMSLQNVFSETNLDFAWHFVLYYLWFYFFISATCSFIGLLLFKFLKHRIVSKKKEVEMAKDVESSATTILNSLEFNYRNLMSLVLVNYKSMSNYGYEFTIIFIQLAIIRSSFYFLIPSIFLVIAIPIVIAGLFFINEDFKKQTPNEHN